MQQTAVKYGIIAGTASALYLFLFHQMGAAFVLNPFVVFGQILISLFGAVLAVRAIREANAGKIERKEALKYAFAVFALSQILFWVFIYLMFNYIDPSIIEIQRKMMVDAGMKAETQDLHMTISMIFQRWAFMLIPSFFLSLMVASFMKK